MPKSTALVRTNRILCSIHEIRGQRVLIDEDLAELYGVETRAIVQAVKRNHARFPADFLFQLSVGEFAALRSQAVISNGRGGRRSRPYAFTEQGVAMMSSVLHSPRAIRVNIEIMRAFVRMREIVGNHRALARKLAALENNYDSQFRAVFEAIRRLMVEDAKPRRRIGFVSER